MKCILVALALLFSLPFLSLANEYHCISQEGMSPVCTQIEYPCMTQREYPQQFKARFTIKETSPDCILVTHFLLQSSLQSRTTLNVKNSFDHKGIDFPHCRGAIARYIQENYFCPQEYLKDLIQITETDESQEYLKDLIQITETDESQDKQLALVAEYMCKHEERAKQASLLTHTGRTRCIITIDEENKTIPYPYDDNNECEINLLLKMKEYMDEGYACHNPNAITNN